jgi:hypothetical protein
MVATVVSSEDQPPAPAGEVANSGHVSARGPIRVQAMLQHDDERTNYASRKHGAKVVAANACAPTSCRTRELHV